MRFLLVACLMMMNTAIFARSGEKGNGGDVYICKDPSQNMILDFYEGVDYKMLESFGDSSMSLDENFLLWISLLDKIDHHRAMKFKKEGLEIIGVITGLISGKIEESDLVGFTNKKLADIPDSAELTVPDNCEKHQLVIQTDSRHQERGEPRYKIQRSLWDQISSNQQALMVAHEIVYREFIERGAENSRDARYYNQMVMSGRFSQMKMCDYVNFLRSKFDDRIYSNVVGDQSGEITIGKNDSVCFVDRNDGIEKLIASFAEIKFSWNFSLIIEHLELEAMDAPLFEKEMFIKEGKYDKWTIQTKTTDGQLDFIDKITNNLPFEVYSSHLLLTDRTSIVYDPATQTNRLKNIEIVVKGKRKMFTIPRVKFEADIYFNKSGVTQVVVK